MAYKRSRKSSYTRATPYAKKGSGRSGIKRRRTTPGTALAKKAYAGVTRLTRMIETKESQRVSNINAGLAHNNVHIPQDSTATGNLNPFLLAFGTADPMAQGMGNRVGDSIAVKGLTIKAFFENALNRARVYYRIMLLKCAKGDVPTRAVLFKNDSNNKMMDIVNTERFTILAQKIFTIETFNNAPTGVGATGVPTGGTAAGNGTKLISMWVPGAKFGRGGVVQYHSDSTADLKFFDYRLAVVAYDWFGTPQDNNEVGRINELFTKLYFKDA